MKSDAAVVRRVAALCREGLERPGLPDDVRLQLGRLVPHDMACWGLLDPTSLWPVTSASTSPASAAALRAWEHELLVADVTKIADLARSKTPVGALGLATGGEPDRSPRYRSVLTPLGMHDELRAVLTVGGVSWGWFALFRSGPAPFTQRDVDVIACVVPHLAHAWRAALLTRTSGSDADEEQPGVLVLNDVDQIESMTPAGRMLLHQLPSGRDGAIADVLHALALSARAGLQPPGQKATHCRVSGEPARLTVPRPDGSWLVLEAAPLLGLGDRVAVTVRQAGRTELSTVLLRSYGLTPRETEIALATLRHDTTSQIAASLFLSPWTVQDHLKAVFAKTGARTRRELAVQTLRPPPHEAVLAAATEPLPRLRFPAPPPPRL